MNILIISTNQNKKPVVVMPLGACMVAEACGKLGHKIKMLDLMFVKDTLSILKREINVFKPDIVGLSVRNIDNNNLNKPKLYIGKLKDLVNVIKNNSKATIVLGGSAVGILPEELLRYTETSLAVTGYGEIVFPKLIDAIIKNDSLDIQGVARIENNRFIEKKFSSYFISDLCNVPDFEKWINVKRYLKQQGSIPVQTKRGCPYNCIYCTYSINEGKKYQLFSPESVADSVERIVEKGFSDIEFVDNVFNSPYQHAVDVCENIKSRKINARFNTMSLNPSFINDRLLDVMDDINFTGIGITAESASDTVLQNLGKGYNLYALKKAALSVLRHNIPCFWMFMLGGPGETKETVLETLEFAKKFIKPKDIVSLTIGIRIYPGTELEKKSREEGIFNTGMVDLLNPLFYVSRDLDRDWIVSKIKKYKEKYFNFIDLDSMELSFLPSIYGLGYLFGIKPPLWKNISSVRQITRFLGINL